MRSGKGQEAAEEAELVGGSGVSFKRRLMESIMANLVVQVRVELQGVSVAVYVA